MAIPAAIATSTGAASGSSPRWRPGGRGGRHALSLRLPGSPQAAASARSALAELREDLDPPVIDTMRLLVTELIANSVKHAKVQAVGLKVAVGGRSVLVEVSDEGPGFEPVGRVGGQDEASGWGLFLVERLSQRWGVARDGVATRVWFELPRC